LAEANAFSMNTTQKNSSIERTTGMISNQNNFNNINNNNVQNNLFSITQSTNSNNLIRTQKSSNQYGIKSPTPMQTISAFSNTSKNINNFNNNINSPYLDGLSQNPRPSSQKQVRARQPSWRVEELYMNFLQEQLRIINECEIDINKYHNLNKDNFDTIKDLKTIKNKALEKIQNAQNNFKDNVGIFPMDRNYNNRVTNLMDMMLEKKINEIQRENKLEMLANNYNKQKQMLRNNDISKNNGGYNYSNEKMNVKVNNNELSPISENEINNKNIMDCCYKSKYEE
jgi:hypothetical protein